MIVGVVILRITVQSQKLLKNVQLKNWKEFAKNIWFDNINCTQKRAEELRL